MAHHAEVNELTMSPFRVFSLTPYMGRPIVSMISGFCEPRHTSTLFFLLNIVLGREECNFENRVTTSHKIMTILLFTPLTRKTQMQERGGAGAWSH